MARRVESPSSINTYNQCPRKYFYTYIAKIPTKGNVHTIKGNVVHSVLEDFFEHKFPEDTDFSNAEPRFKEVLFSLFANFWKEKNIEMHKIGLSDTEKALGIDDCVNMIYLWAELYLKKMKNTSLPFKDAFKSLAPAHKEKYFKAEGHSVHGFIDVIEEREGKVRLMDYKTSSSSYLSDEYLLQLGIYALLYKENVNSVPHEVGIYFLKDEDGEKVLKVTEGLLESARRQIHAHHGKTVSGHMSNYPKNVTYLCKWSTGQCDFYNHCFKSAGVERSDDEIVHNSLPNYMVNPQKSS